jgi:prophage regulatory protein
MRLAGIREAAEILGVSRQRVNQLERLKGFPKPLDRIAAGPVWRRADVEKWAKRR